MLQIERVSHQFGGRDRNRPPLPVLEHVSLTVEDGTFVSFVGPSGCGKTTLLRIIDGLIRPASGRVVVDGKQVQGPSADRAMVFQEFNLLPWRTAQKNAELGLELQGGDNRARSGEAAKALELTGLEG